MSVAPAPPTVAPPLRARRLGLHTQHDPVVVMRTDCHVCRAEGLSARSQVLITARDRQVYATLFQIDDFLAPDEVALSEAAWKLLGVNENDPIVITHAPAPVCTISAPRPARPAS